MNKTIRLCLYSTYYGKDNLVNAFKTKNVAFELEIRTDSSVQRQLLDYDNIIELEKQIKEAMRHYESFKNLDNQ